MCKWVNNCLGVKVDDYGFTLVNLGTDGYTSEPFILAKQAIQVFFIQDPSNLRWHIVMPGKRHILGVDNVVNEEEYDQFDELPPFSAGIPPIDGDITYYDPTMMKDYGLIHRVPNEGKSKRSRKEPWKKVKGEPYDRVWSAIKVCWNIPNDDAKKTMSKKANETFRRFKSKLTQHFIAKKNNNPKATYGVVNMTHWDEFVVSRESEEFKLKSAKAKASALQNKNPSRLGRTALNELEDTFRHRKSKTCGKMVHTMCYEEIQLQKCLEKSTGDELRGYLPFLE
uniref:Ulp1 protease family, C-terminal catalytic domain-containing protein n=1 Tax=Tanacetum cinerariifolium TaxID=118510 RepID=A0A6L2JJB2_TANCI|nr:ulp1 protease family, C-terminal catalytic domain-containing protein [Tanacetum cinerariifolium]